MNSITTRLLITGYPLTGKSSLAECINQGLDIHVPMFSTDSTMHLDWHEASEAVSHWFDMPGPWIIEGVAIPRALRKWAKRNDYARPPFDLMVILREPYSVLSPGQHSMAGGIDTVLADIQMWLEFSR